MSEPTPSSRKPWPMAWVAIAIVAFILIYTLVNVRFRKVEGPHLPYEEAQERSSRFFEFDMNGWKWLTVETAAITDLPADGPAIPLIERPLADRLDRALPMDLVSAIPKRPDLVDRLAGLSLHPDGARAVLILLEPDPATTTNLRMEGYLKDGRLIILLLNGERREGSPSTQAEMHLAFRLSLAGESDDPPEKPLSTSLYTETTVHEGTLE